MRRLDDGRPDECRADGGQPDECRADGGRTLAEYRAVVYDLDGTLVRLAVDWEGVAADVREALADDGLDTTGCSLWDCLELAEASDRVDAFEATVCPAERRGAADSERLPTADDVTGHAVPVGVCSLNCEAACRTALATHGLDDHVDAVVGRDSVVARKPHPDPLLATLEDLGVDPADALFVGDSDRDAHTAAAAGVDYVDVSNRPWNG